MKKGRIEAFSDGVFAILITIMVLELKTPDGVNLKDLAARSPVFISYIFSFIMLGTYWNNHHHLFQITEKVNGKILWANLHLLFWLSLIPFTTAWAGEFYLAKLPVASYGFILFMSGFAYYLLQRTIIQHHSADFALKKSVGSDLKGKLSVITFLIGTALAYASTWLAIAVYLSVLLIWLIPDRRIENKIHSG